MSEELCPCGWPMSAHRDGFLCAWTESSPVWTHSPVEAHAWTPGRFTSSGSALKFMPPGHFCPDVCGIEDFGEADFVRGRVVRAFFRVMALWPVPRRR